MFENDHREGSQVNAFRHVLWQATIANKFGSNIAKEVGNAHEENPTAVTGKNLQKSFNSLAKADETIDLLNNIIGRKISSAHPNADMQELSILVLEEFRTNGLWTANEITDSDGNVTGFTIFKSQLSSNMYNDALKILETLNENGYTESEQKARDEFWKNVIKKQEEQDKRRPKF